MFLFVIFASLVFLPASAAAADDSTSSQMSSCLEMVEATESLLWSFPSSINVVSYMLLGLFPRT